jgi:hypothetical protein
VLARLKRYGPHKIAFAAFDAAVPQDAALPQDVVGAGATNKDWSVSSCVAPLGSLILIALS